MIITKTKKLRQIQEDFHKKFPYLKIEFYQSRHDPGEGSPETERLDPEFTIEEVRTRHSEGDLEVLESMTVREFEAQVNHQFGLNVQVFRKSGNLWMQTTSTDDWTLKEQNRKGGSSEKAYNEKYSL